jgi:hypothetical protein
MKDKKKEKQKMKKVILLLVLALLPFGAYAQKDLSERQSQLTYDMPANGPQGGIQQNVDRAKINEIVAQITAARTRGDVQKAEQLQDELEKVSGNVSQKSTGINNGPPVIYQTLNQPLAENDYNLTILNGLDANWAIANSTDRVTGRLYVVSLKYNFGSGSDTMKIFTSSNNGTSWVLMSWLAYGGVVNFRNDELDIEAMNNGTTSYIYITLAYTFGGNEFTSIYRFNSSGGEFFGSGLYNTGPGNKFIYPRITSDNSKYTTASYLYQILTQDTLLAGSLHGKRTKFSLIMNPFAVTPVITYRNFTAPNSYWWNVGSVADSTLLYNDIAFSDSAGFDRIVTASNFYKLGLNNVYMAYSSNYGVTAPTWYPQIVETNVNWKPRLAATGLDAAGTPFMILTYVRQFNATDWDPAMQKTTNNGVTWTFAYVDGSTDTTAYSDVVAIPRVPNTFRFGYSTNTLNTNGKAFVRTFNNGVLSARFQLNTAPISNGFAPIRAGYRYSATDSCFSSVNGFNQQGVFAYAGCSGTLTGIGNSETPVSFKLSQNYPNPFNPTTKISYALPKSGLVTLKVYDILGKEVAMLVNEVKNAGNYSVDFSASNFTSGVYFYKLESNGFSDIKKMMLII